MEPLLDLDGARALRGMLDDLAAVASGAPAAEGACALARRAFRDAFVDGRTGRWSIAVAAAAEVVAVPPDSANAHAAAAAARIAAFVEENADLLTFARTA
jgi:hypothetical protein